MPKFITKKTKRTETDLFRITSSGHAKDQSDSQWVFFPLSLRIPNWPLMNNDKRKF